MGIADPKFVFSQTAMYRLSALLRNVRDKNTADTVTPSINDLFDPRLKTCLKKELERPLETFSELLTLSPPRPTR